MSGNAPVEVGLDMKRVEVRPYGVSKGAAISRILEQLSALEAEHVFLSHSNQHSRHAFNCIPLYFAVFTALVAPRTHAVL